MQNILKRLNALLYETSLTKTELQQRKLFMINKTEENELLKEINTSKQTTFFFMCCAINFNLKNV